MGFQFLNVWRVYTHSVGLESHLSLYIIMCVDLISFDSIKRQSSNAQQES